MLQAIYHRRYELDRNFEDFELLCDLADYYSALPALSFTLDSALLHSRDFVYDHLMDNKFHLIVKAVELRSAILFRKCAVWICAEWDLCDSPERDSLKADHPKIYVALRRAYSEVMLDVAEIHRRDTQL